MKLAKTFFVFLDFFTKKETKQTEGPDRERNIALAASSFLSYKSPGGAPLLGSSAVPVPLVFELKQLLFIPSSHDH